MGITIWCTVCL